MKKFFCIIIIILTSIAAKPIDFSEVENLISKHQYLDAFNILEKMDPDNNDPSIAIKK